MSIQLIPNLRAVFLAILLRDSRRARIVFRVNPRLLLPLIAVGICLVSTAAAQPAKLEMRVQAESPGRVIIEGTCPPTTAWTFRDSYADVLNLGNRIEALTLFDALGAEISTRKIAPGQFQAAAPASRFRYQVNLAPSARVSDAARVSWVTSERGLLMLRDLLPVDRSSQSMTVRLNLPPGWLAHTNQAESVAGEFEVADRDLAVIAVGHLRISTANASGLGLNLIAEGDWAFNDADAVELATKVLRAQRDIFGGAPSRRVTLILFPIPQGGAADNWSAETRGSSVTLLMGKLPSKVAALARLSVPLTHEFFHFWVPNALSLSGDYDWFYEGFTVYQAAQISVRLDLLTFQEFLNAIGRAFDGYYLGIDRDRWSLLEASKRRWTVGSASVYSKSMVVAFLCDLKLRSLSHNKRSLDDVYRSLFREYRLVESDTRGLGSKREQGSDGSEAALKALGAYSGMEDFARSLVRNPTPINLSEALAPFGLRVETFGLRTRISVSESLTRQQRDLLHDLGYNDYVRSPRSRKPS
jgi:predicted metalloprotease with PDZ domain